MVNSFSVTDSPEQDPKGFAAIAILGAALSLLTTGFVFGTKNNLFHLPIVGMLFDEPQFRHDAFIQSLRFYAAGPFLLLQGADRYVDPATLFAALDALSRIIAFTGFLACATLLGITLAPRPAHLHGADRVFEDPGRLVLCRRRRLVHQLFHACRVRKWHLAAGAGLRRPGPDRRCLCTERIGVLLQRLRRRLERGPARAAIRVAGVRQKVGLVQLLGRGAVGIGIFAVLAAPVVLAVTASPEFGQPTGFDYRTYLDQFWPFHFLFNSIPLNQKLGLLALIMTGSAALMAIGDSARPFLLAFGGYILVYAIGIALPVITDNATLLNLHLLQSGSAIHLLTALATCALATRLMRSTDAPGVRGFLARFSS